MRATTRSAGALRAWYVTYFHRDGIANRRRREVAILLIAVSTMATPNMMGTVVGPSFCKVNITRSKCE